jgi:hypothetical protein
VAQLKSVVDPFGEVNVYPAGNKTRVTATILMEPHREGAQTGIALDGSGSMAELYGVDTGSRIVSPLFGGKKLNNEVTPVAQKISSYLARRIDSDGGTTVIYWAVGAGGGEVQAVGDFSADQAERHVFGAPEEFGTGTQLLPAVRYFTERFRSAPWGFFVLITDGELHDLEEVKRYSIQLARDVAARRRNPVKFVLIGIGNNVNESQMEELDDLDAGVDVDLWDHKLAAHMRQLEEIFAEVVDKNARVADHGRVLDARGNTVKNYEGIGLPAYMEFEVPAGSEYFTLEVNGKQVRQPLRDGIVPPQEYAPVSVVNEPQKFAPVNVVPPTPAPAAEQEEEDPTASEWKSLPLEFGPAGGEDKPDVHLEHDDKDIPDFGLDKH